MHEEIVIVWFKRDLRVGDHAPLKVASETGLPVLPLYIVEPDYWQQPFASSRHWHFIHDSLLDVRTACGRLGQPLVVRTGDAITVLQELQTVFTIKAVYAHEETGNDWTYTRDKQVMAWCRDTDIQLHQFPTNGIIRRLKNRDSWASLRNRRMADACVPTPDALMPVARVEVGDVPGKNDAMFGPPPSGPVQIGGRGAAYDLLSSFLQTRGQHYIAHMSAPGLSEIYGSRLSAHLTWGTVSAREVDQAIGRRLAKLSPDEAPRWRRQLSAFRSRLAWRCHFMQKLEDQPSVEHTCMHPFFEGIREDSFNDEFFEAWKQGHTGYPLIDACMRNLTHHGWITFRMRAMLVSFASYDLWLDWRKTGYHLAQLFTDYEPGIHYSQLQMQSGVTGINAVRIYNPIKQSYDHDPKGAFIRKWVPELADVPDAFIHEPWKMGHAQQELARCVIGIDYPKPVVDHAAAIVAAREKMARVRKQDGFRHASQSVYAKLGSRKRTPRRAPKSSHRAVKTPRGGQGAQMDLLNLLDK